MSFEDRADAGRRLLDHLPRLEPTETVVVALPRGGVPVAEVIADALGAPLDVAIVRKVGLPRHSELAVGAVTDGANPKLFVNRKVADAAGLSENDIWKLAQAELSEAERRRRTYLGDRSAIPLTGKTLVVVDDGIATGSTMHAALGLLRADSPERIIVAVPVAPADSLDEFSDSVDEIICVEQPRPFYAVGAHYRRFPQVPDSEVATALARNRAKFDRGSS